MRSKRQIITYSATIILIYILWYILSLILGSNLLPDPFIVFLRGFQEIATADFWLHVEASSFRLLAGLVIAFILAVPAGKLKGDALTNYQIVSKMPVPILSADATDKSLAGADLVIDALLGTGFAGEPRPPLDSIIQKINRSGKPVVAVDVPSGLDCSTDTPAQATIRANLTITFVAAKTVFLTPTAAPYLGKLQIADIGAPKELIQLITANPHPEAER